VKILLVEDEPRVAKVAARGLREQSYAVDVSPNGADALFRASTGEFDVIILDVMLPVRDGYSVCRELRATGFKNPILMLTARGSVEDRVTGLDAGADDYLVKPFDFRELLARIRALRRRPTQLSEEILQVSGLTINTASHVVARNGRVCSLTAKEYALLEFFALRKDRVVTREQVARHVWDESFDSSTNVIDVYVRRLRTKIELPHERPLIHTRRGEGYMLSDTLD
jgi:two-component system copper resistance phosphate regulon response regulator CusR